MAMSHRSDGTARSPFPRSDSAHRGPTATTSRSSSSSRTFQRTRHISDHPSQSNGIEDARFVEFDNGERKIFYATYTAYSGRAIRSELIETTDFRSFRMTPLGGPAARNKGMALFPRKIDGRYAMIGRQDNENLYLLYSDDLYTWEGGQVILKPKFPWEFVQLGNCGSPIELDEGWLLLTHGVGPIRKYSIGAVLLDKKDPIQGSGPIARAAASSRTRRTRRLRAQCRL